METVEEKLQEFDSNVELALKELDSDCGVGLVNMSAMAQLDRMDAYVRDMERRARERIMGG